VGFFVKVSVGIAQVLVFLLRILRWRSRRDKVERKACSWVGAHCLAFCLIFWAQGLQPSASFLGRACPSLYSCLKPENSQHCSSSIIKEQESW
jgi:hypothetical protein